MQSFFLGKQFFPAFHAVGVRDTAVHGTNSRTLGFIVKSHTFGAFVRYDEIIIGFHRLIALVGIYDRAIFQGIGPIDRVAVADGPFDPAFIDRIIGALRFTGAAIDAFIGYSDCHDKFTPLTTREGFWFGKDRVKHGVAGRPALYLRKLAFKERLIKQYPHTSLLSQQYELMQPPHIPALRSLHFRQAFRVNPILDSRSKK